MRIIKNYWPLALLLVYWLSLSLAMLIAPAARGATSSPDAVSVPEPSTLVLAVIGVLLVLLLGGWFARAPEDDEP